MPDIQPEIGRRTRRRRRNERGQSLIEFTLLAPILIIALLGMAEIGHALNSYLTIVNTARDAARLYSRGDAPDAAALDTSMRAMVTRETERLENVIDTSSVENCASQELGICRQVLGPAAPDPDARVSVRVCYDHPMIIGIPFFYPGPVRMCSTTIMRIPI